MIRIPSPLREIPDPFHSILRHEQDGLWALDFDAIPPHPYTFVGVLTPGSWQATDTEPENFSHSAQRIANAIALATDSPRDLRTLTAWGQSIGVSRGALRVWCKAAGVSARSSLDFLRVLRAIIRSDHEPWDLLSLLDVVDHRSLARLLDRGGVGELCRDQRPTVGEFMSRQTFLRNRRLLEAIAASLARR